MHEHAGTSLYVVPICWTDLHSRLLGVRFTERPVIDKPVPDIVAGKSLKPSKVAQTLTSELQTLVREDPAPMRAFWKNRAIKHVMSTLFPTTLSRTKTGAELNLFFGTRICRKVVRVPCVWKSPSSAGVSFDSCSTIPATSFCEENNSAREAGIQYGPDMPILAYISKSQLAAIRKNLYGVVRGPNNTPNEPVERLQRLRSKMLVPANAEHDPYIVAVLLAMAQAHFYHEPPSRLSSQSNARGSRDLIHAPPAAFRDVKVQIITHDEDDDSNPNFVVYTAVVTATFLRRFMFPHKAPACSDDGNTNGAGMDISYTPVPFWPILGLKERLAKALGREVAGEPVSDDPDHIAFWDPLLEPRRRPQPHQTSPTASRKRRRSEREPRDPLSEVLNSSFEEDPPTSPEDRPVLSPAAKRRRRARRASSTLEVC